MRTVSPSPLKCRTCGTDMRRDMQIKPVGTWEGLVLYTCTKCGATDSTIVKPMGKAR